MKTDHVGGHNIQKKMALGILSWGPPLGPPAPPPKRPTAKRGEKYTRVQIVRHRGYLIIMGGHNT